MEVGNYFGQYNFITGNQDEDIIVKAKNNCTVIYITFSIFLNILNNYPLD